MTEWREMLRPRHWPIRIGLAVLRLASLLPLPVLALLGRGLGRLLYWAHAPRRRIVATNLRLCFPALSDKERARLARRHFAALGQGLFDVAIAWWASARRLRRLVHVVGREHLDRALADHGSAILLAPHFVAMEIGGVFLSGEYPLATLYKKTKNRAINRLYTRVRARFGGEPIEHDRGLKPVVRAMKRGRSFYYLPDQDLGRRHSIFAPFFGVQTATVPVLGRLARLSNAAVLPCFTRQLPFGRGYEIVLQPPFADFPSDNESEDTARMNRAIERGVMLMPEQYFWVHKRFKTRPPGEPKIY